ncbi:hypothetical protein BSP109_02196 [Brevibacterium sp. Mu109]|uniref:hypothetical protein n=1 Tax=Brevibacterium sp. Mu109 TaxID=1255669 RepID=UPI000C540EDC|nr:hypothetical protein [Brevibacterium sp. Mu109]SMX87273.1 hypothetical protein BSP109_02196 [Brevibacterium sp. Mu109]
MKVSARLLGSTFVALLAVAVVSGCGNAQCTAMSVASLEFVAEVTGMVEVGERTILDDGSACATLVQQGDRVEVCQFPSTEAQARRLTAEPTALAFEAGLPMTVLADAPEVAKDVAETVAAKLPKVCE